MNTFSINSLVKQFTAACLFLGFSLSCKKEDNAVIAPPVIDAITNLDDRALALDTGELNQWVLIKGSNLSTAEKLMFNSVEVQSADFFANDTSVTAKIPKIVPENVTNTVTVTTKGGTASIDFVVSIPALANPVIGNEFTPIVDTLTLLSENFGLYHIAKDSATVSFTGSSSVPIAASAEGWIKVIVPADAQPGKITVSGGSLGSKILETDGWYRDTRNNFIDLSNFSGWQGNQYINDGLGSQSIDGKYLHVINTIGDWEWSDKSNFIAYTANTLGFAGPVSDNVLKFEVRTNSSNPLIQKGLRLQFQETVYYWKPFDAIGRPYNTNNQWQTISIPLNDIFPDGNLPPFPFNVQFVLHGPGTEDVDISFCNFRIVPKT